MSMFTIELKQQDIAHSKSSDFNFSVDVKQQNCWHKIDSYQFLLSGEVFGVTKEQILEIVKQGDLSKLASIEGCFCGVLITSAKAIVFTDRTGSHSLYWQQVSVGHWLLSTDLANMNYQQSPINPKALYDYWRYRWLTSEQSIFSGIYKMTAHQMLTVENNQVIPESYWQLNYPVPSRAQDYSLYIEQTKALLFESLHKVRAKHDNVAILLSGGVDSSLLAAMSKSIFKKCLLLTPKFESGANVELETAIAFAKELQLPHHIVDIKDDDIKPILRTLIKQTRQPLRHYSSVAMQALFQRIPSEYKIVVYGEYADSLFGSKLTARILKRAEVKRMLNKLPSSLFKLLTILVPSKATVLNQLRQQSEKHMFARLDQIPYSPSSCTHLTNLFPEQFDEYSELHVDINKSDQYIRDTMRSHVLNFECAKHMEEAFAIAEINGKCLATPFASEEMINFSCEVPLKYQNRGKWLKPILRDLACQYYPKDLIYQRKQGFPVPYRHWLKNPLNSDLSIALTSKNKFYQAQLHKLDVEENDELCWLLLNYHYISEDLFSDN